MKTCLLACLCLGGVILLALLLGGLDDARGVPSLHCLQPLVDFLSRAGERLAQPPWGALHAPAVLAACALGYTLVMSACKRKWESGVLTITCALMMGGQLFFTAARPVPGVLLYAAALIVGLSAMAPALDPGRRRKFDERDFVLLLVIGSIAILFRFYALNRIHPQFEGELSPYALGATSLRGMMLANAGVLGPWAPLGLLYYVPIYLTTLLFGETVLSIRAASAVVSAGTVVLAYVVLRRFSSTAGACVGSLFLSLESLQIGWGRTDVHPHGSTTWPAILICLLTYLYLERRKRAYLYMLVPLMALAWHQYPSGQAAFLIPVFALIADILQRRKIGKEDAEAAVAVTLGTLLWAAGGPVLRYLSTGAWSFASYFDKLGPRIYHVKDAPLPESIWKTLAKAAGHLGDLLQGLYIRAPYLFHQDILIPTEGVSVRTVSWLAIALVTLFAVLSVKQSKRREILVVLCWITAAVLPALFSDRAYPKRAATLYPALCFAAGIGADHLFAVLGRHGLTSARKVVWAAFALGISGWICVSANQWFSGRRVSSGVPGEVQLAKMIETDLSPHTVVILAAHDHYYVGKLSYLLLEPLRRSQPLAWYHYRREDIEWDVLARDPTRAVQCIARRNPYYYLWSRLGETLPLVAREGEWRRALFILQKGPSVERDLALLKSAHPKGTETAFRARNCNDCNFVLYQTPLGEPSD